MAYLEIRDFRKNFGQCEVLKGVSLSVEQGEAVSVIGSSGSGKTTLLRCIDFLETPDSGEMVLEGETLFSADGRRARESELREKRLNFGLVFQSFHLFPQYTVRKNVTLAPSLLLNARAKAYAKSLNAQGVRGSALRAAVKKFRADGRREIEEDAEALLKRTELSQKANNYPAELSGGQQQRVAIARALALKPKVLLFDEPTSALDPVLTGEVVKVLRALKEEGRTMIIVTHEMRFAEKVSDKVAFMAGGAIEEIGAPAEIFGDPKSEKLKKFLTEPEETEERV